MFYSVSSERFTSGIVVVGLKIIYAEPSLKWTIGRNFDYFEGFCKRQGWTMFMVQPSSKIM